MMARLFVGVGRALGMLTTRLNSLWLLAGGATIGVFLF
jgi:hypothetical protein